MSNLETHLGNTLTNKKINFIIIKFNLKIANK